MSPDHGNLGDHAILEAEKELLEKMDICVHEIPADDRISYDLIEKTLEKAKQDPSIDIVKADVIRYVDARPLRSKYKRKDRVYETVKDKKRLMLYGENVLWGKLYKTSLFKEHQILQPALPCEDLAVYPSLIAVAEKIATCYAATAYYQVKRCKSLSEDPSRYRRFEEIVRWAKDGLVRAGQWERYKDTFYNMMCRHFRRTIIRCLGEEKYNDLQRIDPEMYRFKIEYFGERNDGWSFPYEEIKAGSQIILYGAGSMGKSMYDQISGTRYCRLVAWLDRKYSYYRQMGAKVDEPEIVRDLKYDMLMIAIDSPEICDQVKEELMLLGVEEAKIWMPLP